MRKKSNRDLEISSVETQFSKIVVRFVENYIWFVRRLWAAERYMRLDILYGRILWYCQYNAKLCTFPLLYLMIRHPVSVAL